MVHASFWNSNRFIFGVIFVLFTCITHHDATTHLDTMCAPAHFYSNLAHDTLLLDSQFLNISTGSLLACVKQCQLRRRCASYNFSVKSGECILNEKTQNESMSSSLVNDADFVFSEIRTWPSEIAGACAQHNCSDTSVCEEVSDTEHQCIITHCTDPPTVNSGSVAQPVSAFWEIEEIVEYQCNSGFEPVGERLCRPDGSWGFFDCLRIASCADLKACNSDYGDGEYWLKPPGANGSYVKIYCHEMDKASPINFVTLEEENYSYFLEIDIADCLPFWTGKIAGRTTFSKVKFNIWNFGFQHGVYTFAVTDGKFGNYGRAGDCRGKTTCSAHETGSFRIDTTGTGLKVVEYLEWSAGTNITRSQNGRVITGECYSDCKLCKPEGEGFSNGRLTAELDLSLQPSLTSAVFPVCKVNI